MKIAVLASHTASLSWFRMDMMKDFIDAGYSVIALGPEDETKWKDIFKENKVDYRQFNVERNGLNPIKDLKTIRDLCRFMKEEKPDKVFTYQAKTIIYGSIAAKLYGIKEIYPLLGGLGSIFRGTGIKNKILKTIMKIEYRFAFKYSKKVFFENNDDRQAFLDNRLVRAEKTVIINGSGVNLEKFLPSPLPADPAFLFIGRLIKDKGIGEYLEASKIIKEKIPHIRCLLVGPYDSNPSALKPEEIQPYIDSGIIEYFGEQADVRPFIAQSSTFVLPSYHEGTPKTVLEAMAMGRAIITSDAPGCRETVIDGMNGYLVTVKDIQALTEKMLFLVENPDICNEMGRRSLEIVKEKYDVKSVNRDIMQTMGL